MADSKISALSSGAPAQAGDEYIVARSGANYKLTLTNIAANMPATTVASGDLTFSSTGQRITGDFSNATISNRLMFQGSVSNATTFVGLIPNGTGTTSSINCFGTSDPTNAPFVRLLQNSTSDSQIRSDITGTGSYTPMTFYTGGSERMRLDTSGNVGIGGTAGAASKLNVTGTYAASGGNAFAFDANGTIPSGATSNGIGFLSRLSTQAAAFTCSQISHYYAQQATIGAGSTVTNQFGFHVDGTLTGATSNFGFYSNIASGANRWNFYANGTARNYFAGGTGIGVLPTGYTNYRLSVQNTGATSAAVFISDTSGTQTTFIWNQATSGDNVFTQFGTDGGATVRGSISYNRVGGLVAYNTTSDYRAKDVYGAWNDSGATIDALKVYRGKMHGATLERPMMIAHEAQAVVPYAVGGEKDAVDKDGKPVYQTMDHQILVPLLIAELQAVRARLAALEAK
jgi:hypothetical protein